MSMYQFWVLIMLHTAMLKFQLYYSDQHEVSVHRRKVVQFDFFVKKEKVKSLGI